MNDWIYILQKDKTGEIINIYDKIPDENTLDEDYCEFLELNETFYGTAYRSCHMVKWNPKEGLKPYYIKSLPELKIKN